MKKVKLNNGDDYSEEYIILECEYEQLTAIEQYYKLFEVELVEYERRQRGASRDICNVVEWLERNTSAPLNDNNYCRLLNRLSESNNNKFGTHGDRRGIVKIR